MIIVAAPEYGHGDNINGIAAAYHQATFFSRAPLIVDAPILAK